jgi:hypothetical protein
MHTSQPMNMRWIMTEKDLPVGVRTFIMLVRISGGEVLIDYETCSIGIKFDDPANKEKFFAWMEQMGTPFTEETLH